MQKMSIEELILKAINPDRILDLLIERFEKRLESWNNSTSIEEKPLSREKAADYLDITLPTLHDWANKGIIRPHKVEGRTYYLQSELLEAIKKAS